MTARQRPNYVAGRRLTCAVWLADRPRAGVRAGQGVVPDPGATTRVRAAVAADAPHDRQLLSWSSTAASCASS